jgi:hypothetical protein
MMTKRKNKWIWPIVCMRRAYPNQLFNSLDLE